MNTVVCVKQVPDCAVVKYDIRTNCLENVHYIIDPIDEISVSEALKIRERNGGEVTAITLGPPRAEKVMRSCLKMGVDHAIHLCDESFDHIDSYSTSYILAKYVGKMKYDLILCGNQSMDEGNGYVGAGIARYLKLPLVTAVTRIDIFTDTMTATVHRRLKGGDREIIESPLPAVLTVVKDEPEAEILCGLLQANGIECAYRDTEAIDSPLEDFTAAGAREILVRPADLEAARALLPDSA